MNRPEAWYDKRQRMWAIQLTHWPDPLTYWRGETGDIRYFITAQEAYDAHAKASTTGSSVPADPARGD